MSQCNLPSRRPPHVMFGTASQGSRLGSGQQAMALCAMYMAHRAIALAEPAQNQSYRSKLTKGTTILVACLVNGGHSAAMVAMVLHKTCACIEGTGHPTFGYRQCCNSIGAVVVVAVVVVVVVVVVVLWHETSPVRPTFRNPIFIM
eukprot:356802-Chlamydomonas_euryale.AAC.3